MIPANTTEMPNGAILIRDMKFKRHVDHLIKHARADRVAKAEMKALCLEIHPIQQQIIVFCDTANNPMFQYELDYMFRMFKS